MTAFSGNLSPGIETGISANRAAFYSAPIPLNSGDGKLVSQRLTGARTNTQPIDQPAIAHTGHGAFAFGYGAIFYNRIQIAPSIIDLGNLLTTQARNVSLWNGFLASKSLESLSWSNAEGVSISSPVAVPSTLGPLQEIIYIVTAITDGPSTIDALFNWQVDGDDYELQVLGNRIVVFPFLPDWRNGLTEGLEWQSSVERAFSGDEQRRELRAAARKTLNYDLTILDQHEAARIENMLFGWQSRNFAIPIPTDRGQLTSAASLGVTVLNIDTTDLGFYAGQPALLYIDSETYEAVDVQTVSAASLTLVRPTANAWPIRTWVFPAGVAHLPSQQTLNRETDYYITAALTWQFAVGDANANTPSAAAALSYLGYEVNLILPDWSGKPTFAYDDAFFTYGADEPGLLEFEQTSDFPSITLQHRYVFQSRAIITTFRQFLKRRSGRVVPCWIPSWNSDFIIMADVDSSAGAITVRDNGYRAFINAHAARRDIAIFLKGIATPLMLRITGTADNLDGTINLIIDGTVGTTFTKDSVSRVSHMNLYRLGSDGVTLSWQTDQVVTATLNWVLVKG
jgi:hypothetical protein